ncbi:MAG: aldo/keto reductase [archaeon]|nr:aldo/keto reductase [archaeon]MCP8314573.1 aldo/keto reductase [archaeon]
MNKFPVDYGDKKPLGNTDEYVPAIGIGTWDIKDYSSAIEALTYAVDLGLNMIDTAEMYQDGKAEEIVGTVVKRVGRDRIFITTKLLPERFEDGKTAVRGAEASLWRLGISYADLILIHWPTSGIPIKTQIKSLEVLADRGLTRHIGVSNFEGQILIEALASVKKHQIVVDQVKYSVLDKRVENDTLPLCIENKITIQAYTPLEKGAILDNKIIADAAKKYRKTIAQVALNYLISRPMVTAIPKSERKERINEFWGALGWRLSQEDLEVLEAL